MKLKIQNGTIKVLPYEYRDRADIKEVIIPDSIETIGEGAFKDCHNLSKLTIGRNVKQVGLYAFDGIGKKLDIVWLSNLLYKSPFIKILPPFEEIDSICAPYRNFFKAGAMEKRALVCGFILHPEYEKEYDEGLKKEYLDYINNELSSHFNELADRGMILDVFLSCYDRKFIWEKELIKQFISYIRTRRMTMEEKELIDEIEGKEGLLESEEDLESKKLRRFIRQQISEKQMHDVLMRENLSRLPVVLYKNSNQAAPEEALKFILTSYISQWTYLDSRPSGFHFHEKADDVASRLERESLEQALEVIAFENDIKHPRRMIPFLRYANDIQIEKYIQKSEGWKDYDKYGEEGILAKDTFDQAILINETESALLYAYRNNLLNQYAFLRKMKMEELFLQIVDILEKRNETKELNRLEAQYIHSLHVQYLSGSKIKKADWLRLHMEHPFTKKISESLVWEKAVKNGPRFLMTKEGAKNEYGEAVILEDDCEIAIAHPVFMSFEQIQGFRKRLEKETRKQCFHQLKHIKLKLDLGDWQYWNRRYYKMHIPYEKLQELTEYGFKLDGRKSERLRVSFFGKVLMETFPTADKEVMELGYLLGSNYNMREINESCSILDDVFCYEMILTGRCEAAPYLERFDAKEIEELLNASIELKHNENIAALLEQKKKLTNIGDEDDLALDW